MFCDLDMMEINFGGFDLGEVFTRKAEEAPHAAHTLAKAHLKSLK